MRLKTFYSFVSIIKPCRLLSIKSVCPRNRLTSLLFIVLTSALTFSCRVSLSTIALGLALLPRITFNIIIVSIVFIGLTSIFLFLRRAVIP